MEYYVDIYFKDGTERLGNCEGQGRIIAKSLRGLRQTHAYQAVKRGNLVRGYNMHQEVSGSKAFIAKAIIRIGWNGTVIETIDYANKGDDKP